VSENINAKNNVVNKFTAEDITTLKSKITGAVLLPNDKEYEEAREIWNGIFDKKPAIITRCKDVQDVVESVNFARDKKLLLAVKGGGHNSAGTASCDDGIMIDLSLMKEVKVNIEKKTVKVEGGCLLSHIDEATQEFGLVVPSGIISHTGVGGLTLGGGFGWISRKFGFSIDNLLAAEVVTAEGKIVKTNEDNHPDLFWALRGGGGNFGIVTKFEFQCAEIGKDVYAGLIVKKFKDAKNTFSSTRTLSGNFRMK